MGERGGGGGFSGLWKYINDKNEICKICMVAMLAFRRTFFEKTILNYMQPIHIS